MKRSLSLFLAIVMLLTCLFTMASAAPEIQESISREGFKRSGNGCAVSGLFIDTLTMEDQSTRSIYHYYPATLTFRRPVVFVAVPDGVDAVAWADEIGWFARADKDNIMLILMVPGENGWQVDETEYTHACYDYAQGRYYYTNDDAAYYMIGYGAGADAVMCEAMTQADMYAGMACLGGTYANAAELIAVAQENDSAEAGRKQCTVPCPIWIGAAEKTAEVQALIDYWCAADECNMNDVMANAYADEIYAPAGYMLLDINLSDTSPSKVYVSIGDKDYTATEFTDYMFDEYLFHIRREDSWEVPALRWGAEMSELGVDRYDYVAEDGTVEWFVVYVPTDVKAGKYDKVPLMFVTHGASGEAEETLFRTGMYRVAEQYNFIMVSCQNNSKAAIWKTDYDMVLANYPMVDTSRVYLSGQSMGCNFCQTVAENYPELIAAVAAASLVNDYREEALAKREIKNPDIQVPVFVSVGYLDHHFPAGGGDMTPKVPAFGEYWLNRAGIEAQWIDDANGWTNTHYYDFGIYHNWVGLNGQGIPMFRWQRVDAKTHAFTTEEGIMFYEYAAQFSRGEDGTLYYMGIPVTK